MNVQKKNLVFRDGTLIEEGLFPCPVTSVICLGFPLVREETMVKDSEGVDFSFSGK